MWEPRDETPGDRRRRSARRPRRFGLGARRSRPQIAFDAIDALKPPVDMHLGEVAGVADQRSRPPLRLPARLHHRPRPMARRRPSCWSSGRTAGFVREIGKNLYAWSYAHNGARRSPGQHLGRRQGLGHGDQVHAARARVAMVFGRKPGGQRRGTPIRWSIPTRRCRAVDGQFRQVTDMAWDSTGQHLHRRRLHQLARWPRSGRTAAG